MPDLANDLIQFADGLMAARMGKIDLDISDTESPRLLTEKDIEHVKNTKIAPNAKHPDFETQRLDAAFQVFRQAGSLTTAIEGLSFRTRGQRRLRQLTSRTLLYLILIVGTAIGCLGFFWFWLRPELDMIRADIIATGPVVLEAHNDGLIVSASLIVLLLLLCVLLGQLFGKTNWFTRFSGGQIYLNLGQQALFWSTTERLVEAGRPISESTTIAGRLLAAAPQQQTLPGGIACESLEQILSVKTLLEMLARQKIESISNVFPTAAVVIVGGGCALICVLATFYPIVRLLNELATVALA